MASSYINNLRLAEMATGDASGTWGTVTNTNLTLIADALGFQSFTVANANEDDLIIPDGTETNNEAISLYVKLTGGNQAATITLGPNTVKKLWIIENSTSHVMTLSQGTGDNVILASGVTKMVYANGTGSGASVVDALVGLEVGTTLYIKNAATGDDSTAQLFLQTAEADIQANDVLGSINFQAPNEGTGTDAITAAARIQAISEGDFSASNNATSLEFRTASSGAVGTAAQGGRVRLTSDANLIVKDMTTADGSSPTITLQTGDTDIAANDILGSINFQAPDEAAGTDAIAVAASIQAVSEGDFSSSSNASSIKFTTASSAASAIGGTDGGEMSLLSNGALLIRDKRTNGAPTLALQSGRTDVSDGNVLAGIEMYAPVEASGTDAILVGAAIKAIADADFSSSSNATSLQFQTGASATATTRFAIASDGSLSTPTLGTGNVRFGVNAGNSIVSGGNNNTVVGDEAGTQISTGDVNTFVGYQSGDATTTSGNNVGVGYASLTTNILSSKNVGLGVNALKTHDLGSAGEGFNVAVGHNASESLTTGVETVTVGGAAGEGIGIGTKNTFVGYAAGSVSNAASDSVGVGHKALVKQTYGNFGNNTVSTNNVAVGFSAGAEIVGGLQNTILGSLAGDGFDDANNNVAVGYLALSANAGNANTACGANALQVATGADNTALGQGAGFAVTSGSNNTLLGHDAGVTGSPGGQIGTSSNKIVLGDENISECNIQVDWTVASDQRDKTDFTALDVGLDFVNALKPYTYKWDKRIKYVADEDRATVDLDKVTHDGTHKEDWLDVGFKAQEVEVLEKAAGYKIAEKTNLTTKLTGDGKQYGMQYSKFVPILVKAIQELTARIKTLEDS